MKRTISPSTLALAAVLALSPGLALAQDANALDQVEGRNAYLERAVKSVATETSRFVAEVKTARGKHLGFGVVIDGGYVLTSNDILAPGDLVVGVGGRDQAATVAGRDLRNDVALLRVQWQTEAPAGIPLGSSKDVPIGAIVYVGGILDGPVLAAGVVSAKNRRVEPSAQQGNILMGLFSDGNSGHKRAFPSVVHHDAPSSPSTSARR